MKTGESRKSAREGGCQVEERWMGRGRNNTPTPFDLSSSSPHWKSKMEHLTIQIKNAFTEGYLDPQTMYVLMMEMLHTAFWPVL